MADALSRKATGSLNYLITTQKELLEDIEKLRVEYHLCGRYDRASTNSRTEILANGGYQVEENK